MKWEYRFMKFKKLHSGLIALGLCCSLLLQTPVLAAEETTDTVAASAISTNDIAGWPQGPDITSTAAVIMEDSTNTTLYAKNMDQVLYPGATVKVMTTLLALENTQLSDQVTMTATGVSGVTDGGANISAQIDEIFTVEQCLYAIMLASANDVALQLAEHIGGSVDGFVQMMNARAAELGCTNTVFTNPTGLPDENQHTTAHDMALIFREAIKNQDFLDIIGTQSFTIDPTNMNPESRTYSTHHALVAQGAPEYYEGCFGGKTGVTEASKNTLVSGATRDGMTLIAVAMRADAGQVCQDHISMFDYGFNNFQKVEVPGGAVTIPKDVQVSDLTNTDNSYYYGTDYYVGSGSKEVQEEEPSEIAAEETTPTPEVAPESPDSNTGQEEKTQDMTVYRYVIYILAGLIAVTLVVTIVSGIRKHMKKKKRRKKS